MFSYFLTSSTPLSLIQNGGGYVVICEYPSPGDDPSLSMGDTAEFRKSQGHTEDIALTRVPGTEVERHA